ncbi:hypothetical protein G9A89_022084 [Geosiphon pyriformis]|nr:hypothetical protein G9A89_022084 [Geosiphon pyriformis]
MISALKNGLIKSRKQEMQIVGMQQECSKQSHTFFKELQKNKTNEYYSNAQILDQFIAELKDKLIKKVCPHVPENLATAIRHVKNYEMAMEEANHTKLVNLVIEKTSSAAEKKLTN